MDSILIYGTLIGTVMAIIAIVSLINSPSISTGMVIDGKEAANAQPVEIFRIYLKSFESQFINALEERRSLSGLAMRNSTSIRELIGLGPKDICIYLDVKKDGWNFYHADNHLGNKKCSEYVKVLENGLVGYDFSSVIAGSLLNSLKSIDEGGHLYMVNINLVYAG